MCYVRFPSNRRPILPARGRVGGGTSDMCKKKKHNLLCTPPLDLDLVIVGCSMDVLWDVWKEAKSGLKWREDL